MKLYGVLLVAPIRHILEQICQVASTEAEHIKRMENDLFSCYGQENKMDSYVRMKGERYG
jgi:hypothetical protein